MARILVIDDDAEMRLLLRRMLEPAGHEVVSAESGETGLERFRESPADLVITDLLMPHKGGAETIVDLKTIAPKLKILGISGGDMLDDVVFLRAAGKAGDIRWLAKPFTPQELTATVAEMLGGPKK